MIDDLDDLLSARLRGLALPTVKILPRRYTSERGAFGVGVQSRTELETRRVGYVLAIGCDRRVPTQAGLIRADELAASVARWAWQRLSAGAGGEGAALLRLGASTTGRWSPTPTPPESLTRLAMVAHALLAVIAAREHDLRPAPDGLIALTCNEIRRLFTTYVIEPGRALACPLGWSLWRRRHQHRAQTSHYQRQEGAQPWT